MINNTSLNKIWRYHFKESSITEPTQEELKLSESILIPELDKIQILMENIRQQVDENIYCFFKEKWEKYIKWHYLFSKFPVWNCYYIVSDAQKYIEHLIYSGHPILKTLKKFINKWWTINQVYWVKDEIYFHNVIQAWSLIFNIANDSVNPNKKKVICGGLKTQNIRSIKDYFDYIEIAEFYQKADIYLNHYIPSLAPLFPLIKISPNGWVIKLATSLSLLSLNLSKWCQPAYDILFESDYINKTLPPIYVDLLSTKFDIDTDTETIKREFDILYSIADDEEKIEEKLNSRIKEAGMFNSAYLKPVEN